MDGQNSPSWYPRECSQKGQSFPSERILPARNPETRRGVYRRWALGHPSLPGASKAHTSAGVGKDQSRYEKFRMKSNHAKSLCLTPVPTITNAPNTGADCGILFTEATTASKLCPFSSVQCSLFSTLHYGEVFTAAFLNHSQQLSGDSWSPPNTMMDLISRFLTISE